MYSNFKSSYPSRGDRQLYNFLDRQVVFYYFLNIHHMRRLNFNCRIGGAFEESENVLSGKENEGILN